MKTELYSEVKICAGNLISKSKFSLAESSETQKNLFFNPGVLSIKKKIEKNTDHSSLIFLNTINHNNLYTTLYNYTLWLSKKLTFYQIFWNLLHTAKSLTL